MHTGLESCIFAGLGVLGLKVQGSEVHCGRSHIWGAGVQAQGLNI